MMKITLMWAVLAAISLGAGLSGCAGVSADVSTSNGATPAMQGERTYALARTPSQDTSSDQTEYEALVRSELERNGFSVAPEKGAHYLLSIAYDTRLAGVGVLVGDCANSIGRCSEPDESGFALFGHTYSHSLTLRFFDQTSGHEVYKVSATSRDRDADALHAIPYLVKSALARVPFVDHADWRVKLRVEEPNGAPQVVSVKPVQR